jgi:uncharacterized membrane protein
MEHVATHFVLQLSPRRLAMGFSRYETETLMKSILTTAIVALSLAAASAFAQDLSKATTQADCEKAGGSWDAQANGCGEKSAKMGEEEGTHQGANLSATPRTTPKRSTNRHLAIPPMIDDLMEFSYGT